MGDEISKDVISAMNSKTAHGMMVTKFFFRLMKQVLKTWLIQACYWDHESLLLTLTNVYCTVVFGNY